MGKKKTLRDHAEDLAESLAPAVESARDKAGPYVADARDKAAPLVSDARDRVAPLLDEAKDRVAPMLVSARDIAAPYLSDARDAAAPYVADARDKVSDTFSTEVLPVLTAALAALDDATEDARGETAKRGRALASALRGEVEAPGEETSTHRLRNVLVALGLGAAGFAIVRRLNSKQQADSWQSSYTARRHHAGQPGHRGGRRQASVSDGGAVRLLGELGAHVPGGAVLGPERQQRDRAAQQGGDREREVPAGLA